MPITYKYVCVCVCVLQWPTFIHYTLYIVFLLCWVEYNKAKPNGSLFNFMSVTYILFHTSKNAIQEHSSLLHTVNRS